MKITDSGIIKYGKEDIGVIVEGATKYSSTEQSFEILKFASYSGMDIDDNEIQHAILDYQNDDGSLGYDFFEDLGWAVEEALDFLNTQCTEDGVAFTFRDTDLVLIGGNEFE